MKAILDINGFTKMIDWAGSPTDTIIIPLIEPMRFAPGPDPSVVSMTGQYWEFTIVRQLDHDLYLYKWTA